MDISTCLRTSKSDWRPRLYSTANPGGVGHAWYKKQFITPSQLQRETFTRFIAARVTDNPYANPEYRLVLDRFGGGQRRAWLESDWDIAAGQFFTSFRRDVHVLEDFDDLRGREWSAALDYGYTHYTVCLLACTDGDGNTCVVDEHAARMWLPERHAGAIKAMIARHRLSGYVAMRGQPRLSWRSHDEVQPRPLTLDNLKCIVAGTDVFSRQSDGRTIAQQYSTHGITLRPANMDRINGWVEVLSAPD